MLKAPAIVKGIIHPLIQSAYLKKDFSANKYGLNVLVIESSINSNDNSERNFSDLLIDLKSIEEQAEKTIGHIDRVDIVTH